MAGNSHVSQKTREKTCDSDIPIRPNAHAAESCSNWASTRQKILALIDAGELLAYNVAQYAHQQTTQMVHIGRSASRVPAAAPVRRTGTTSATAAKK